MLRCALHDGLNTCQTLPLRPTQLLQHQLPQVLVGNDFNFAESIPGQRRTGQRFQGSQPFLTGFYWLKAGIGQAAQPMQQHNLRQGCELVHAENLVLK